MRAQCKTIWLQAPAAAWSMPTQKLPEGAQTCLIRLMQRFGHENCGTCFFLRRVTHKTSCPVHAQGVMIIVHHFQRLLAATQFPGLAFHSIEQTPSDAFAAGRR